MACTINKDIKNTLVTVDLLWPDFIQVLLELFQKDIELHEKNFQARDLNLKVYVEDTDFQGFVYHANYIKFFERARSEFLQNNKISQKELRINNLAFVVKRIEVDFLFQED